MKIVIKIVVSIFDIINIVKHLRLLIMSSSILIILYSFTFAQSTSNTESIFYTSSEHPITIIEFSDYECYYCAKVKPTLQELEKQYPGKINWVFKHYPPGTESYSDLPHKASLAAKEQGKFLAMQEKLFANPIALKKDDLIGYAKDIGLNVDKFKEDLDSNKYDSIISADKALGQKLNVNGTPTFFINGKKVIGSRPLEEFKRLIDKELGYISIASTNIKSSDKSIVLGKDSSPVKVALFYDIGSSLGTNAVRDLRTYQKRNPEKVQVVFKHFPTRLYKNSKLAHEALVSASEEGKHWEMYKLLSLNQKNLDKEELIKHADSLGFDTKEFKKELDEHRYLKVVRQDIQEGMDLGVRGVPTYFINGKRVDGYKNLKELEVIIDAELKEYESKVSRK